MADFSVIVVAAGKGERFGDKQNKIFAKIGEQPLFLMAVQLFCNREDVRETILVVSPDDAETVKSQYGANLGFMGVKLVEGGAERHDSVRNGLTAVSEDAKFVAVHDAVRVCVAEPWIDAIFEAARKQNCVVPTTPVTSTIKRVGDDRIVGETVPREGLYLAQTPQVFARPAFVDAYAQLKDDSAKTITDDAQVLALAGYPVTAIDGDARNIKITTKADLALAKALIKTLPQKSVSSRGVFEEAQW